MPDAGHEVTGLLVAWRGGDPTALDRLIPLIHDELHRIAVRCLRGDRHRDSMPATALVNEAFLRLVDVRRVDWHNRVHFMAMAARVMRRVLVDLARARQAEKRGADFQRITFDEDLIDRGLIDAGQPARNLLRLDEALQALAAFDERKSRVVELRFFGGMSIDETAAILEVSSKTVMRDWDLARAWLQREIVGRSA